MEEQEQEEEDGDVDVDGDGDGDKVFQVRDTQSTNRFRVGGVSGAS